MKNRTPPPTCSLKNPAGNIKSILEILIPTYNRKPYIERTLKQLTAEDSPVKDCPITVLDNASEDGSSEAIDRFISFHKNIKHIRHPKNIGGNANITRCYEMAKAPYVWVVCDDDAFKWDAWPEIENALKTNEYDLLITSQYNLKGKNNIAKIFRQCTFVPAGIYKTSLLTNSCLINMHNNVPFLFPHLSLISEVLNKNGRIFLPKGEIMNVNSPDYIHSKDVSYTRGNNGYVPGYSKNMFWTVGVIISTQLIKDKNVRNYILDHIGSHGFFGFIFAGFRPNYKIYNGSKFNEAIARNSLDFSHRLRFDLACLLLKIIFFFVPKKTLK